MPQDPAALKTMPLYRDVDRIHNELRAAGLDSRDRLAVTDLVPFDQYHYHGTDAIDVAIETLGIDSESRVLEVGSGIGGPARYLAMTTGAQVVAVELQPDLNETAHELTSRCGLDGRVQHVCADVLDYDADEPFDMIVSWLAFFHVEQRAQLLECCFSWLNASGGILVEDLYARGDLTLAEKHDLEVRVYSRYLPERDQYESDYRNVGFTDLRVRDMSDDWRKFTHDRYADFCANQERHLEVHGKETVAGLKIFYGTMARLFAGGNLGGIRISGSKI